jgi:LAO/AO transport system kinase
MCIYIGVGAGFNNILVETVGVGQSEMEIVDMVDVVVLVVAPGQGDSLQAMKKGINEAVQIVAINKCEREGANETFLAFKEALSLSNKDLSKVIKMQHIPFDRY